MNIPQKIETAMFAPCGMAAFLEQQKVKYSCPECGGIISIHDAECSECQYKM